MSTKKTATTKPSLPVNIKLPERVMLENGTMFATLLTLDDFRKFWDAHRDRFAFACTGSGFDNPVFLRQNEWVFGTSKHAVVQTAMRWNESGITVEFFDCARNDPEQLEEFFLCREHFRDSGIKDGTWNGEEERAYQADCVRRTRESYRGWWQLKNLPEGRQECDWFVDCDEIIDPHLPVAEVERTMQEQTFDDWMDSGIEELTFHGSAEIDQLVFDWITEKAMGSKTFYGQENDISSDQASDADSQTSLIAMSPYSSLLLATETIAGELETILDEEIEIDSDIADALDAHNLTPLHAALDEARMALKRILELGSPGSHEAMQAFDAFDKTVRQVTVEDLRDACVELDPQAYLSDYVVGVLSNFEKHVEDEDEFDSAARDHQALPPAKAD